MKKFDNPPANFDLAPLHIFNNKTLLTENAVTPEQAFIIAISVAYNDLKDYYWIYQQLKNNPPSDPLIIDPQIGQWNGMNIFCIRKIISTYFEFLQLIKVHEKLFKSKEIQDVELILEKKYYNDWNTMKEIATTLVPKVPKNYLQVLNALKRIRNNISSHYYDTKNFAQGFKSYAENPESKTYVSLGKNMEGTRFFYADASTQKTLENILQLNKITIDELFEFISKMNTSVRGFIECFLKIKSGEIILNRKSRRYYKSLR